MERQDMRAFIHRPAPKQTADLVRSTKSESVAPYNKRDAAREAPRTASPHGFHFSRIPLHHTTGERLQTKLTVNIPGDVYEQEADRVADAVMRMPESRADSEAVVDTMASPAQVETSAVPAGDSGGFAAPPIVHDVLRSPGQPLDTATRTFMEPRFGQDFSDVRVHTDAGAAESAAAVGARAYAVNRTIVFGSGEYAPTARKGQDLLAHELAHTMQKGGNEGDRIQRQHLPYVTKPQRLDRTSNPAEGLMERQKLLASQIADYQIRPASQPGPKAWQTDTLSNGNPAYYKTKAEAEERSHGIGQQWEETKVESFHQAGKTYWRVRMRGTRTVLNFVALLKKFESSHPGWKKEQVVNSLRRLGGYDTENFQKFYGTAAAFPIVPSPGLPAVDIEQLR
jgi:hypothetical protein